MAGFGTGPIQSACLPVDIRFAPKADMGKVAALRPLLGEELTLIGRDLDVR